MHNQPDTLGNIIKLARENQGITVETLSDKVGITERYLYRIENEGKKPSFDILYKLVRELSISSDSIFYPEKSSKNSELESLIHTLYTCDEKSIIIINAIIKVFIENLPSK